MPAQVEQCERLHSQLQHERACAVEPSQHQRRRERELTRQVEEMRAHYTRRLRELEGQLKVRTAALGWVGLGFLPTRLGLRVGPQEWSNGGVLQVRSTLRGVL